MCNCPVCKRSSKIEQIRLGGDIQEMRNLISELHNLILNLETDNERYEAILRGEWPGSLEFMKRVIKKKENNAPVAELEYAPDLGSGGETHESSTLSRSTS